MLNTARKGKEKKKKKIFPLLTRFYRVVYTIYLFWILIPYQKYHLQTLFFLFSRLSFCLIYGLLCCEKAFESN